MDPNFAIGELNSADANARNKERGRLYLFVLRLDVDTDYLIFHLIPTTIELKIYHNHDLQIIMDTYGMMEQSIRRLTFCRICTENGHFMARQDYLYADDENVQSNITMTFISLIIISTTYG